MWYTAWGKRAIDLLLSAMGLVVLGPVLLGIAIVVYWKLGRPVLFRQVRAGLTGTPFTILKFRTMTGRTDAKGQSLPDPERQTPFGRWLRASSLDELPELVNVLRGDMSLVGPRPLHVRYVPRYTAVQARRHDVRPGITGWAQINGRNDVPWDRRLALDVWYVDHLNPWLDLTILARTMAKVLTRDGVTRAGHDTSEEFAGSTSGPPV